MSQDTTEVLFDEIERLKRVQNKMLWGVSFAVAGTLIGSIALIMHLVYTHHVLDYIGS